MSTKERGLWWRRSWDYGLSFSYNLDAGQQPWMLQQWRRWDSGVAELVVFMADYFRDRAEGGSRIGNKKLSE
ncbi:hypothetical protein BVRB_2g029490 [Beta vulgaris subsp. vulgaris]|nr:hypothetical protein BVRB_2g029490 [Beta vulgaris subsp. vulgaris]